MPFTETRNRSWNLCSKIRCELVFKVKCQRRMGKATEWPSVKRHHGKGAGLAGRWAEPCLLECMQREITIVGCTQERRHMRFTLSLSSASDSIWRWVAFRFLLEHSSSAIALFFRASSTYTAYTWCAIYQWCQLFLLYWTSAPIPACLLQVPLWSDSR